jgi:hypothetical protein
MPAEDWALLALMRLSGSRTGNLNGDYDATANATKILTFLVSVALAATAAAVHYFNVPIPYTQSGFTILLAGYAVLLFGNLLDGV